MNDFIKISSKMFLREDALTRAEDRFAGRILNRAGAYIRNAARRSIRTRPGTSPPGKPPHNHRDTLRDNILFAASVSPRAVYIGPTIRRQTRRLRAAVSGAALLEFGGHAKILVTTAPVPDQPGKRYRLDVPEWRPAVFRARPFMAPARDKGLRDYLRKAPGEFPDAWRVAIT